MFRLETVCADSFLVVVRGLEPYFPGSGMAILGSIFFHQELLRVYNRYFNSPNL